MVSLPVPHFGGHRCQLFGPVFHSFHRRGLLFSDQFYLYLWCFQEDDQASWLLSHQLRLQSGLQYALLLCLCATRPRWGCLTYCLWGPCASRKVQAPCLNISRWNNDLQARVCYLRNHHAELETFIPLGIKLSFLEYEQSQLKTLKLIQTAIW